MIGQVQVFSHRLQKFWAIQRFGSQPEGSIANGITNVSGFLEGGDSLAELLWIDHCGELLDDPFLDQGVDPGAGMRSGDAQLAGDIGIGHAAIFDQQVQQFSIGRVH